MCCRYAKGYILSILGRKNFLSPIYGAICNLRHTKHVILCNGVAEKEVRFLQCDMGVRLELAIYHDLLKLQGKYWSSPTEHEHEVEIGPAYMSKVTFLGQRI